RRPFVGDRFIPGGGWNDPDYLHGASYVQPPFDRSPTNGLRLARYAAADTTLAAAQRPLPAESITDFIRMPKAPDPVFAAYRRMYDYDRTPLKAKVEAADTTSSWVRERISFDAAYGRERVILYLYRPRAFS